MRKAAVFDVLASAIDESLVLAVNAAPRARQILRANAMGWPPAQPSFSGGGAPGLLHAWESKDCSLFTPRDLPGLRSGRTGACGSGMM